MQESYAREWHQGLCDWILPIHNAHLDPERIKCFQETGEMPSQEGQDNLVLF